MTYLTHSVNPESMTQWTQDFIYEELNLSRDFEESLWPQVLALQAMFRNLTTEMAQGSFVSLLRVGLDDLLRATRKERLSVFEYVIEALSSL